MKFSIVTTILAIGLISGQSQARSVQPLPFEPGALKADLVDFNVDRGLFGTTGDILSGSVEYSAESETVTLFVQPATNCPPNAICAAVLPQPVIISLDVTRTEMNRCGVFTVEAETSIESDPPLTQRIIVEDYARSLCEEGFEHPTQVHYSESNGGFGAISWDKAAKMQGTAATYGDVVSPKKFGEKAELEITSIENGMFAGKAIQSAQVQLDTSKEKKTLTLTLQPMWSCPEGAFCATVMPGPIVKEFTVLSEETDACGTTRYQGTKISPLGRPGFNPRRFRNQETIEYFNHKANVCIDTIYEAEVTFTETTYRGRPIRKVAKFSATEVVEMTEDDRRPIDPIQPIRLPEKADLTYFNINFEDKTLLDGIKFGEIQIDYLQKAVTLKLIDPRATFPQEIKLPIKEKKTNACKNTVWVAAEDRRAADGDLRQITITDRRTDNCKYFIAPPQTAIEYKRVTSAFNIERKSFTYTHQFHAKKLATDAIFNTPVRPLIDLD